MRVHKAKVLIAGVAALAIGLTACSSSGSGGGNDTQNGKTGDNSSPTAGTQGTGNFANCATEPLTCNSGSVKQGGTISYAIEKTIPGWNQLFTPSNVFEVAEVEDGILPPVFTNGSDLQPHLNTDLMESATQTSASPQTLVYKIKPDAVWSDGTPINFNDFKYIKDTSDGTTCPKCQPSSTAGYSAIKSITGSDNGKTVTVVMKTPFADWKSMFGPLLPAHIAAKHGGLSGGSELNTSFQYFDKNVPTFSGGPMIISNYQKDTAITETPNPKWYGATKSKLSKLVFRIITDQTQEPTALQNGEINAAYPQPNANLAQQMKAIQNVQTYLGKGLVWEHFDFNTTNQFFKDKTLRQAIFTAISRKDVIGRTIGTFVPGASPLGNHMYVPGQPGYTDNVTSTGQGSGNVDKAKSMLTKAGYKGVGSALKTPSGTAVHWTCLYSAGNTDRQTECEIVQNVGKQLGAKVTLKTTPDLSELGTGQFDMVVFAWVGTPYVVAGAQQIWELKGGADYGKNDDPAMEKLINEAATSTNQSEVQTLMNKADKLLTADAYVLPLYQKPTFLAAQNDIVNIRDNATSNGPPVNVQQWGYKAS